ncbi:MAG: hypothetical protein ACI9JL_001512 [Paracoccaceae bacterium]|jgi:hypothetical protein
MAGHAPNAIDETVSGRGRLWGGVNGDDLIRRPDIGTDSP